MDKDYELQYHKLEENYWWFQSRRDVIFRLIKKMNLSKDAKILEVGCSGGPLITLLKKENFQNIYGIDLSKEAIEVCRERGVQNTFVMDALNLSFDDKEFDLVIASDILEHIEDDFAALTEWNRVLKTNGKLIVFVPAFKSLWSHHDEINHHYRRYTKTMLLDRLRKNGFKHDFSSYWNFTLFFPSFLIRFSQRIFSNNRKNKSQGELYDINPVVNRFLIKLISFENKLLQFIKYPVGVSVFAISRKIN